MTGTCADCIYCDPKKRVNKKGRGFAPVCNAKTDGVHEPGWGKLIYNQDGTIKRTETGLLVITKCFYWKGKENVK